LVFFEPLVIIITMTVGKTEVKFSHSIIILSCSSIHRYKEPGMQDECLPIIKPALKHSGCKIRTNNHRLFGAEATTSPGKMQVLIQRPVSDRKMLCIRSFVTLTRPTMLGTNLFYPISTKYRCPPVFVKSVKLTLCTENKMIAPPCSVHLQWRLFKK
jgi:hypothetical protein